MKSSQCKLIFPIVLIIYVLIIVDSKRNFYCIIEKGFLTYYNKNFGKNVHFNYSRVNSTFIKVSASYDVIDNTIGSDVALSADLNRYVNNQWKKIPLMLTVNICEIFEKNQFLVGLVELTKHGNITPCKVTPSHYYVKDYVPDLDFPLIVPPGKYWAKGYIKLRNTNLFIMDWYADLRRA